MHVEYYLCAGGGGSKKNVCLRLIRGTAGWGMGGAWAMFPSAGEAVYVPGCRKANFRAGQSSPVRVPLFFAATVQPPPSAHASGTAPCDRSASQQTSTGSGAPAARGGAGPRSRWWPARMRPRCTTSRWRSRTSRASRGCSQRLPGSRSTAASDAVTLE